MSVTHASQTSLGRPMNHSTDSTTEIYKKRQEVQTLSSKYREAAMKKYKSDHVKSVQIMKDGAYVEVSVWISKDELS